MRTLQNLSLLVACVSLPLLAGCAATPERQAGDDRIPVQSEDDALSSSHFNRHGNVLIADQYNNRIVELDKKQNIVWSFGDGSSTAGPTSIVAPNDAERVGSFTLIVNGLAEVTESERAGLGSPPGAA